MNLFATIATLTFLGTFFVSAQNVQEEPKVDPVEAAIEAFANRDKKPNEVVVVLEPPAPEKPIEKKAVTPPPDVNPEPAPLRVTGNLPPEVQVAPSTVQAPPPEIKEQAPEPLAKPETALIVRVEKLQTGRGKIDPAQVKLLTPYPAKPLSATPAGWSLDTSASAPPFTREVEIAPGSKITLTISPHLLVPAADGSSVFAISEPGYDNSLGHQQSATVGAILANSVRQLDNDSKQLSAAIDSLQQLLVSLPKPESLPAESAAPAPTPAPTRKK